MNIINQLPQEFINFLRDEGIDENIFTYQQTHRYIRTKYPQITLQELQQQISSDLQEIQEIPTLYSLPKDIKIVNTQLYKDGLIYGIDKSSAAVVISLDINKNDKNILEICCAPGAKLTFIADNLRQFTEIDNQERKVYGIDISQNRLNITSSLIQKYQLDKFIELIQADGTTYESTFQFDKVLIDAECTHEGSIKHLQKYINKPLFKNNSKKIQKNNKQSKKQLQKNYTNQYTTEQTKSNDWSIEDFKNRFLDEKKLKQIYNLQYSLLENGFKLLKQGGYLIYSTCSFSKKQNEDIIIKFLDNYSSNSLLIHPFYNLHQQQCKPGYIFNTVRFDPTVSNTSGMFIAKIQKL